MWHVWMMGNPKKISRPWWDDNFKVDMGGCWLDSRGSEQGQVAGLCEYGNELWGVSLNVGHRLTEEVLASEDGICFLGIS